MASVTGKAFHLHFSKYLKFNPYFSAAHQWLKAILFCIVDAVL